MEKINKMSIKEFLESGLLQEVNRQFFHPRGLALDVVVPDDPTLDDEYKLGGVWDYRDDPEGMIFGHDLDQNKHDRVEEMLKCKAEERLRRYGWVIQPVGN
jgi:hypothetical protein